MLRRNAFIAPLFLTLLTNSILAQSTERVSVDSNGAEADRVSERCVISADGNVIAFESRASNLVPNDTNDSMDIFVHDRRTGETSRVSVNSYGDQANSWCEHPSISADGRYVAFQSAASNLVPPDINIKHDIFVHDRLHKRTYFASRAPSGPSAFHSYSPAISANGRYIAYKSDSDEHWPADNNGADDIFVYDSWRVNTRIASVNIFGNPGGPHRHCRHPAISGNGRFVAFASSATNFHPDSIGQESIWVKDMIHGTLHLASQSSTGVAGGLHSAMPALSVDGSIVVFESTSPDLVDNDNNSQRDIFRHNIISGETIRVSVPTGGGDANGLSFNPSLSGDGRFVVFMSRASNLVANDNNGVADIFIHDCENTTTEIVSIGVNGIGDKASDFPSVSTDASEVAFWSEAENLVDNDLNDKADIFVYASGRQIRQNQAVLIGDYIASVGDELFLQWYNAPPNQPYTLAWSSNLNGSAAYNWTFDLGAPYTIIATGTNNADGTGTFTSAPLPSIAQGRTLYFELGFRNPANGAMADSVAHVLMVN